MLNEEHYEMMSINFISTCESVKYKFSQVFQFKSCTYRKIHIFRNALWKIIGVSWSPPSQPVWLLMEALCKVFYDITSFEWKRLPIQKTYKRSLPWPFYRGFLRRNLAFVQDARMDALTSREGFSM